MKICFNQIQSLSCSKKIYNNITFSQNSYNDSTLRSKTSDYFYNDCNDFFEKMLGQINNFESSNSDGTTIQDNLDNISETQSSEYLLQKKIATLKKKISDLESDKIALTRDNDTLIEKIRSQRVENGNLMFLNQKLEKKYEDLKNVHLLQGELPESVKIFISKILNELADMFEEALLLPYGAVRSQKIKGYKEHVQDIRTALESYQQAFQIIKNYNNGSRMKRANVHPDRFPRLSEISPELVNKMTEIFIACKK